MSAWTPIIVPFVVGFISFILVEVYKARKSKKSEPTSLKSAKILNDREVLTKFMGLPSAEADELLKRQTERKSLPEVELARNTSEYVARQAAAEKSRKEAALKLKQAEVARANAWNARHKELSYKLYINEITQKQYDDLVALHKVEEALQAGFDAVDKWEYLSKGDNIALGTAEEKLRTRVESIETLKGVAKGENVVVWTAQQAPKPVEEQADGRRDRVGAMWPHPEAAKSQEELAKIAREYEW